jgi:hypothetical protein
MVVPYLAGNRRRHPRISTVAHDSLERSLRSWRRLERAWKMLADSATVVENWERLALAESKLEQCEVEITRLKNLLHTPHGSS